jgi:hypothetical protein
MLYIKSFNSFKINEAISSFVTINTSAESMKVAAVYNDKSKMGVIRLVGKKGPRDYKVSVSIPVIYTGPVQPIKIEKRLTDGGTSSEYKIFTNVKGQSHMLDKEEVLDLVKMYNHDMNNITIGRATFTRTWKFKDVD